MTRAAGTRLVVAAVAGAASGAVVGALFGWSFLPLVGWVVAALVFLVWTWSAVWTLSPDATHELSQREDPSRAVSDAIMLGAAIAALLAVALVIFGAGHPSTPAEDVRLVLAVSSVACAWGVLHTLFTMKYARQYYRRGGGGISFNQDEPPAYRDFAYLAFTVGMTFQVSDTDISRQKMRTLVLSHALVAYVFGAVIIAVTINLLAGLSSK